MDLDFRAWEGATSCHQKYNIFLNIQENVALSSVQLLGCFL